MTMKNLPLSLLGLIFILFTTNASAQVASEQARNFQIDATHTGSSTTQGVIPPLSRRWTVNFGRQTSYPLIADGKVFVTVGNGNTPGATLFALDSTSGALVWSFPLDGNSQWAGACYENGRVFAVNGSGLMRAFDGQTGAVIWTVQLPGQSSFSSAPTVSDGVIYTSGAGSGGTAYAVSANSGALLWTRSVINGSWSSPAVTSDGVYVSYSCPNVYKLDPATGASVWQHTTGCSGGGGKAPVLYNGRLYVRDFSDVIFDSQTGAIIGSFVSKHTPAFSGNRGFFLNGPDGFGSFGTLQARDVNTGAVLWNFSGDGTLQSAVLVVNDFVYVGSAQGRLYAVDAETGQQVWVTNTGSSVPYVDEHNVSQPLTSFAAGEGLLVVPTTTTLIAYERDTTPPTLTFGARTPAPNTAGWNNTPVDIAFTTADDSGVQSSDPSSPLHFTAEGANQTQQVTVTDNAGNTATFTSPAVNIDLTKPSSVAVVAGASPDQEWFSGPVTVTLDATDNLSGVKPGSHFRLDGGGPFLIFGPFFINSVGRHTLQYASEDRAGNIESLKTRFINIDPAPPVTTAAVSGTVGTNGWHRSAVQVTLNATDNLNAVQGTFYRIDFGAVQTYAGPFGFSTPGVHTIEYWSIDHLYTETSKTLVVKIDAGAPVVTAAANPSTAPKGPKPVNVTISGSVTDAVSGIGSASFNVIDEYGATQPSGAVTVQANGTYSFTLSLPANRPGNDKDGHLYTIIVTGIDQAGNSTTATTTFRVN